MALDTGVRTLQRRLAAENANFRSLTNRVLIARAKELIAANQFSTTQIAVHLGFGSSNNFSRAFKTQTGLSPTQFRKQQQG
jgi:AraC-like DNA-binding protein